VITTHALFALKVQRKVSNGIAGRQRSIVGSAEIAGQFVPTAMPLDGQRPCRTLAEDPGKTHPELRIPALQLKREWSPWPQFGSDPGNPRELPKG
jgi:hypothetical protein